METHALTSKLYSRAQPIGTILMDSPLSAEAVLENLRERGREWRESSIPEDLRKLRIGNLIVEIEGSTFRMRWGGANSLYNPVCFGTVEPYGNGSRIRAGFKLDLRDIAAVGLLPAMTALALLGRRSTFNWVLFAISLILLVVLAVRNRGAEPMRARLIEVLSNAANQARKPGLPYTDPTF